MRPHLRCSKCAEDAVAKALEYSLVRRNRATSAEYGPVYMASHWNGQADGGRLTARCVDAVVELLPETHIRYRKLWQ